MEPALKNPTNPHYTICGRSVALHDAFASLQTGKGILRGVYGVIDVNGDGLQGREASLVAATRCFKAAYRKAAQENAGTARHQEEALRLLKAIAERQVTWARDCCPQDGYASVAEAAQADEAAAQAKAQKFLEKLGLQTPSGSTA
jgi:hypothetical protein